jgi:Sec-independent protein translocase protein TatA
MLGIGFFEIVIIALVCFVAIGPKQLPVVMRKLAGFYRQFVLLKDEFRFQIMNVESELKETDKKLTSKPASPESGRENNG